MKSKYAINVDESDVVAQIMNKWYITMDKQNLSVQPKASTILGTILADYDIKEKDINYDADDLWKRYMDTKGGEWNKFWSGLSNEEKDYIEARRQKVRDKYYAERGLEDDNRKSLLKG